jgi:mannose-6-phosphate isomerase-like protein (cupin superfamily)
MKKMLFAAALLAAMPVVAQAAEPAIIVSAADIQKLIATAKAAPARPTVIEPIIKLAPYAVNLEYRVGKAPAAVHQAEAELMFVIEGSATLTTGGTLVGGAAPKNGNINGTDITGGTVMHFAKGDVTIIPENTPHMLLPDAGGPLVLMTLHVPRSGAPAPAGGRGPAAPKLFTSAADIQAMIARGKDSLPAAVAAGRLFSGETLLSLPPYRVGLEYRSAKGTASVHKTDAEFMWVLDGSGTMNTDGALVNSHDTNPTNSEGDAIGGGKANHMSKGDFVMIPQNGPHQSFTDGQFVLATLHLPRPDAPAPAK